VVGERGHQREAMFAIDLDVRSRRQQTPSGGGVPFEDVHVELDVADVHQHLEVLDRTDVAEEVAAGLRERKPNLDRSAKTANRVRRRPAASSVFSEPRWGRRTVPS
jgi:hypothetical protein